MKKVITASVLPQRTIEARVKQTPQSIEHLNGVRIENAKENDVLSFDGEKWKNTSPSSPGYVIRTFRVMDPRLSWEVPHNLNTKNFIATIRNSDNIQMFAAISIVDENNIRIDFTEEVNGWVDIVFNKQEEILI